MFGLDEIVKTADRTIRDILGLDESADDFNERIKAEAELERARRKK